MNKENIRKELLKLKDEKYKKFILKLIPNLDEDTIIGIRVPILKKFVKEYFKNQKDIEKYLNDFSFKYFEEKNIYMYLLNEIKDINEILKKLNLFLTYVDNWATCDIVSNKILKKYPNLVLEKIENWIKTNEVYKIRHSIVLLLTNYLDENFDEKHIEYILNITNKDYYIFMAISWYLSIGLVKQYDIFIKYFENNKFSKEIHNKSIQKAIESFRIEDSKKEYLKSLKIRKN